MTPSPRSTLRLAAMTAVLVLATSAQAPVGPSARAGIDVPPPVAREFRAAWVSPVQSGTGGDWPSVPGLSADSQKAELRALLDRAKAIGLNAVAFHVRTAGDAMYPSKLVPWSAFLTGRSGVAPTPAYDPLAFAIGEAHARGLQFHAWFNPFRAVLPNIRTGAAANHVTKAHPAWIRTYGSQVWINPGDPAARASVLAAILEVVDRYDVDGIHLDDYFYPYQEYRTTVRRVGTRRIRSRTLIEFPDYTAWTKYGVAKGFTNKAAWRRSNVDDFVQRLHEGVKQRKPWMAVGISPFGIWRPGHPVGVTGLDAYSEIFADSRKWLAEGWLDYIAPQLYWPIGGEQERFLALNKWWHSQNPHGRHIYPGLYTAQVVARRNPWPLQSIAAQIAHIRDDSARAGEAPGHMHFRLGALMIPGGLGDLLRDSLYAAPAIPPAMPWLGGHPPAAPRPLVRDGALALTPGDTVPVAWWLVQTRTISGTWNSSLRAATQRQIPLTSLGDIEGGRIAITAIDRVGQASAMAIVELR